jgi:hypothetical protein
MLYEVDLASCLCNRPNRRSLPIDRNSGRQTDSCDDEHDHRQADPKRARRPDREAAGLGHDGIEVGHDDNLLLPDGTVNARYPDDAISRCAPDNRKSKDVGHYIVRRYF